MIRTAGDAHARWHSYRGALRGVSPSTREGRNGPAVQRQWAVDSWQLAVGSGQWAVVSGQELEGLGLAPLLGEVREIARRLWTAAGSDGRLTVDLFRL